MSAIFRNAAGFALFAAAAILAGCAHPETHPETQPAMQVGEAGVTNAVCVLHPTEGNQVRGIVTFTKEGGKIRIVADMEGLTPGDHGFHIHEFGDCSAIDATSAGGHFNPGMHPHGSPSDQARHAGDLGNITADSDGRAHLELTLEGLDFSGPNSILGRGMIVHSDPDDLTSQPTGNAGGRVACGVIGVAR